MGSHRTEQILEHAGSGSGILADRYQLIDKLGQGGMGTVYRVLDRATGEVRALKLLTPGAGRTRFRGEFLTLFRLRHPNIVRVFDYGTTEEGNEYFTMELLRGSDFVQAGRGTSIAEKRKLLAGLLRGLRFIHGRGMVHADLKPSNVMVLGSGELGAGELTADAVRILDFGLATDLENTRKAGGRGSFGYAAPEAYAGRIDTRSDLYAFGVILYQLLTDEKPFPGDRVEDVVRRQTRGRARNPRSFASASLEIPDELAELALRLLDPEPNARYQTADEVLRIIEEREGGGDEGTYHWEGTALVGRTDLLDHIDVFRGAAKDGRGAVLLLAGERGSGRTRLLANVKFRVQLAGERYVGGTCGRARPYQPFAEVVWALTAEYRNRYPELFAVRAQELAQLTGTDVLSGSGADLDTLTGTGPAARSRRFALHDAVADLLLELSRREPLVIAVDGLDEADQTTREMFAYVARTAPSGRYLLLGVGAENEAALLDEAEVEYTQLEIPPLNVSQIRELLDATFGADTASSLAEELFRATGGNPGHLEAALRALIERGDLRRHRNRWVLKESREAIPTPEEAVRAGHERLEQLDAELRRILSTAAVMGPVFRFSGLPRLVDRSDDEVAEALSTASALGLVRSASIAEDGEFAFTSPGIHRAMVDSLPEAERKRLALEIGKALEVEVAEAPSSSQIEGLARLFLAAGDVQRAHHYGVRAARLRASLHDHRGAVDFCNQVLQVLPGDDAHLPAVLQMSADHCASLNELVKARDLLLRAEKLAKSPQDIARIARKIGDLEVHLGDAEGAVERMKRVAALYGKEIGPREHSRLLLELTVAEHRCGRFDTAAERADEGLELARRAGDLSLSSMHRRWLGNCAAEQGRPNEAVAHFEAAVEDAERGGSDAAQGQALSDLGIAYSQRGETDRAVHSMERALGILETIGDLPKAARVAINLATTYYHAGRWELAGTSYERALEMVERSGAHNELLVVLGNLANLYRVRGRLRDALATVNRALRAAERAGAPQFKAQLLGQRATILSERGKAKAADADFAEAAKAAEELGTRALQLMILAFRAHHCVRHGRIDEAERLGRAALRLALATGRRQQEAMSQRVLAAIARKREELDDAENHLDEARNLARSLGAKFDLSLCDLEEAELALARGHPARAAKAIERATDAFAELGAGLHLQTARGLRDRIATETSSGAVPARWMATLLEATRAIGQTLDVEEMLEKVLEMALETTRSERGFLILLDEMGRPNVRKVVAREEDQFDPGELQWSNSVVGQVVRTGRPLVVVDVAQDDRFVAQQSIAALGLRSALCVPMWRMGKLIGILYVDSSRTVKENAEHELAFLEALASQAAVAIENARLFAEERQRADVTAMLAHEINNPLGAIIGFTDLIEHTGVQDQDRTLKYVRIIREQGLRLLRLLKNVMAFAKMDTERASWTMADVSLDELLPAALTAMLPLADAADAAFDLRVPDDIPPIHGNADRVTQVVTNLLSNAIKFSPKGGTIHVSVTHVQRPAPPRPSADWVPFPSEETGGGLADYVQVCVEDEGPGVPSDKVEAVFGKFAQVDTHGRRSRGVGLGLYIVRRIIEQHSGEVWVESDPGKGARFCFRLPVFSA